MIFYINLAKRRSLQMLIIFFLAFLIGAVLGVALGYFLNLALVIVVGALSLAIFIQSLRGKSGSEGSWVYGVIGCGALGLCFSMVTTAAVVRRQAVTSVISSAGESTKGFL